MSVLRASPWLPGSAYNLRVTGAPGNTTSRTWGAARKQRPRQGSRCWGTRAAGGRLSLARWLLSLCTGTLEFSSNSCVSCEGTELCRGGHEPPKHR